MRATETAEGACGHTHGCHLVGNSGETCLDINAFGSISFVVLHYHIHCCDLGQFTCCAFQLLTTGCRSCRCCSCSSRYAGKVCSRHALHACQLCSCCGSQVHWVHCNSTTDARQKSESKRAFGVKPLASSFNAPMRLGIDLQSAGGV